MCVPFTERAGRTVVTLEQDVSAVGEAARRAPQLVAMHDKDAAPMAGFQDVSDAARGTCTRDCWA